MPGHPDGQNYAIWRGPDFFASQAVHIDSTHPVNASGQVTNYASLIITLQSLTTPGITVTVTWFTDQTQAIQIAQQNWIVPPGYFLDLITPCMGNFVTVKMVTTDAVGANCSVAVMPTNTTTPVTRYLGQGNHVTAGNLSIAANAVVLFPLVYVSAGKGHLFFQDIAASTKLEFILFYTDIAGVRSSDILRQDAPVGIFQADFNVADLPVGLRVQNTDAAAAHNVGFELIIEDR